METTKKGKFSFAIDKEVKPIESRDELWEALDRCVRLDPMGRFSNRSEAIRFLITVFVMEVERMLEEGKTRI